MFDRLPGRRANLRPFHIILQVLCLLLVGCVTIDIETRVSRDGSAIRHYRYQFTTGAGRAKDFKIGPLRMADLGLESLPGVVLMDSSVYEKDDSTTVSTLSCRAVNLNNLSQPDDSISLEIISRGLWRHYRYHESFRFDGGGGGELSRLFSSQRFRHRLRLPGRIIRSNGDSLRGGWAVWSRSLMANQGSIVMEAESKTLDLRFLLGGVLIMVGASVIIFWRRRGQRASARAGAASLVLLFLLSHAAGAIGRQPVHFLDPSEASQGAIRFFIQPAVFRGTPERACLEVSYALPLDNLQFLRSDSTYRAGYAISLQAFDDKGRQAAGDYWERDVRIDDYATLSREQQIYADTLKLMVAPGRYRLRVVCSDKNSERRGLIERMVEITDFYAQEASLGGVRFEREQEGSFLPWARKSYGGDFGPIAFQLRLYAVREIQAAIQYEIWEEGRRTPALTFSDTNLVSGESLVRKTIPVDSLGPGRCRIRITARTLSATPKVIGRFEEAVQVSRYAAGRRWEMESSLEVLRYIASRKELKPIEKAPPQVRDSLIDEFWSRRDPTPGTVRNEAREEFYQRVDQANRQFTLGVRPGWRTDRGRIYIKYGPPDDIERHPFDSDYPAYEIWTYYLNGLQFMFMDIHGYGEYKLMNPKAEDR